MKYWDSTREHTGTEIQGITHVIMFFNSGDQQYLIYLPSGKRTQLCTITILMGKSTISMGHVQQQTVSLPEGIPLNPINLPLNPMNIPYYTVHIDIHSIYLCMISKPVLTSCPMPYGMKHPPRWFVKASSCPLCKNDLKICGRPGPPGQLKMESFDHQKYGYEWDMNGISWEYDEIFNGIFNGICLLD